VNRINRFAFLGLVSLGLLLAGCSSTPSTNSASSAQVEQVSYPNLVGSSLDEATASLTQAGLIVGEVRYQDSGNTYVNEGDVYDQSPYNNTEEAFKLPKGAAVDLTIQLARTPTANNASPNLTFFANCADVKAAGKAPLKSTDVGYRPGLDRDGDGIACDK